MNIFNEAIRVKFRYSSHNKPRLQVCYPTLIRYTYLVSRSVDDKKPFVFSKTINNMISCIYSNQASVIRSNSDFGWTMVRWGRRVTDW